MAVSKPIAERRHLFRIFGYIRPEWAAYVIGLACLGVCDGLQFVVPRILGNAVDRLAADTATSRALLAAGGLILLIALGVGVFRFLWRHFIVGASIRIDRLVRRQLFGHLLNLPQSFYQHTSTGDLMARATNDIRAVQMAAGIGVVILADTLVMGVTALAFMIYISPTLTLYTILPLVLIAVLVLFMDPAIRRRFGAVQRSFSGLTERFRENIAGIRVVKAYVQEAEEIGNFSEVSRDYVRKNLRFVQLWGALFPSIMGLMGLAMAVTLFFGGRAVIFGEVSIGEFVAFTIYLGMLSWPMMAIGWAISIFQRGTVSMGRIAQILDEEPVQAEPDKPLAEIAPPRGALQVSDLTFAYAPGSKPVLKNLSFSVEPGGTLGVVGRVGSGKSTLLQLLLRLWEPPEGTVFVDGMDITRLTLEEARRRFAWVPQESFLFSDTLSENIAFQAPGAAAEDVREAARVARIHEGILGFPGAYDTKVGERGVTLSGGERQRVSIARAWFSPAPVLLLDDCLSAVDAETEKEIIEGLTGTKGRRTVVIVSHRVSAVEWADEILVLEDGEVAERGRHEDLKAAGGLYAEMVRRQHAEMADGFGEENAEDGDEPGGDGS